VAVLGSTGSIGTSALKVLARQRERFRVVALTAHGKGDRLEAQVEAFRPPFVALVNGDARHGWRAGSASLVEAATRADVDIVLNGIVGAAGLEGPSRRCGPASAWRWPTRKRWSWRASW
jgi:1-deoxy-D-xylulose-5-phosphate reductoisomerase